MADRLRSHGLQVAAPELHRGSLGADVAAAQESADSLSGPVVACGWSYGGMVISGLRLPAGSHLVYLAAILPDEGETSAELMQSAPSDVMGIMQFTDDGHSSLDPARVDEVLWPDASADQAAVARGKLRPQALAPMMEPLADLAWKTLDSTFVICTADRAINPDLQRRMAVRAQHVVEWDTSHSPLLSQPALVGELLRDLVPAS